jgi:hypothetical protein
LKRRKILGLVDLFEVSDPGEIQALASDTRTIAGSTLVACL